MTIDMDAYLDRIGHRSAAAPDLATLRAVVAAHVRTIPFENLDPLTGVPVADLGPDALAGKLVGRLRGGYCYEQNGLMGNVLEQLGFGVEHHVGRAMWMRDPSAPPSAQTHQMLIVTIPGEDGRFLVDVGFGGPTPPEPLRFEAGTVQRTDHEAYRLVEQDGGYVLQAQIRDAWKPLYAFADDPRPSIDLEVGSWYVSTHPASKFVSGLTAAIVTDDGRHALRGRYLVAHRGGGTERVTLRSAAEVMETLTDLFRIDLDDFRDRTAVEARISEVLDS